MKHTRAALRWFNWSAGLRAVFDTVCSSGSFVFVALVLSLGVPRESMGFFGAMTQVASVFQLLSLGLVSRVPSRKRYAVTLGLVEPVVLTVAIILALVAPASCRLYVLAGGVFLAAALRHLTVPVTDDWLASTIPSLIRGRYIGRRSQVLAVVAMVGAPLVGWIADRMGSAHPVGLALLFAVGGLTGVAAVACLGRAHMPTSAAARVRPRDLLAVWRFPVFRRYLAAVVVYNLPFFLCGPYNQVMHLDVFGLGKAQVGLITAGAFVVRFAALSVCSRLLNRVGGGRMVVWVTPLYVLWFLGFALSAPGRLWPLLIGHLCMALGEAAYSVAAYDGLCEAIPKTASRPACFVVYNLGIAAAGASLSLLAVGMLGWLKGFGIVVVGPWQLTHFHLLFALSAVLMAGCGLAGRLFPHSAGGSPTGGKGS
jgi:MFS family permease